jgi:hypothetical protein
MTYLYTFEMEDHICRYIARFERYFITVKISYDYTYVLESAFFDRHIIYIFKSIFAVLW